MSTLQGRVRRAIAVAATLGFVLGACSGGGDDAEPTSTPPASTPSGDDGGGEPDPIVTVDGQTVGDRPGPQALGLRLSEGQAAAQADDALPVVDGAALTADEVAALLARLPAWDVPPGDRETFNRPAESIRPPLIGDTIDTPFPPPAPSPTTAPDPDAMPLEVVRFQPDGPVEVAPFFTITFNQPMVPLATLDQLDAGDVPAVVTPAVEGRWRWIGTRTLRFEVEPGVTDRLPAATEYTVEVPAGTTAVNGAALAEAFTFSFATPAPRVVELVGWSDSMPLEPVFVATFDQLVDPEAVLATTTVRAGDSDAAIRVATADEVDADDAARQAMSSALDGRAVAFRTVEPLPADTAITITIGPGTPSREGPLTTTDAATYSGRTYGALRIVRATCNFDSTCVPGAPFAFEMSNALEPETFSADLVRVDPAIPGMRIDVFGNTIQISGATAGRTTYTVTLAAGLTDVFGQTLGADESREFEVGPADPMIQGLQRDWITTDPSAAVPSVSVQTVNHNNVRVIAWAVTPADTVAFRNYLDTTYSNTEPPAPDWPAVLDEEVAIDAVEDQFVETAIDLSAAFAESSQLVVRVEPTETYAPDSDKYWQNRPTVAWVQSTTLGVDAVIDNDELLIWTTDLRTGEPVGDVPVELVGGGRTATTDGDGITRVELGTGTVTGLIATDGERTSFLPAEWYGGWQRQPLADEARWYVFDDRGIYRPGETARVTGWVRRLAYTGDGRLGLYDTSTVGYRVYDAQGAELATGEVPLNVLGGFNMSVDLPAGANLGQAWIEFTIAGAGNFTHPIEVQEFRRPEFEVTARTDSPAPYYTAVPATVAVDATYFAGGPLPDAEVDWLVTTRETTYQPPNWDQYTFGIWTPWWFIGDFARADTGFAGDVAFSEPCFDCGPGSTEFEQFSGRTDASGTHYLQIEFDGPDVDLPTTITAEATVFDVNRQAWASRTDLLVHAAEFYVGLRSDRAFVEQGTPIRVDAVVTDVDGNAIAGREVEVTAGRLEWRFAGGEWKEELVDPQTCAITSSENTTDDSMRCEFTTDVGGQYRITATVTDDSGHHNRTELTQWVSGGAGRPTRGVDQQTVTIVPDRETYAPGESAELLVQAPFAPAYGLMTVTRNGIVATERFDAPEGSAVLQIPISDDSIPNLNVQIDMVGAAPRTADDGTPLPDAPARPAFATAQINLRVPPVTRALTVTATPVAEALEPGADTSVTVAVNGPDGTPVAGAQVALVIVDEAVLSLTGYELADPLDVFYGDLSSFLTTRAMRSGILLTRADLLGQGAGGAPATTEAPAARADFAVEESAVADAAPAPAEGGRVLAGDPGTAQNEAPIQLRENFDALAVYAPEQTTGEDGTVTVDVPLPDTLTRYRVMAVAVDGAERFGKGESTITARLPLMVRPSAPRFLNFGDRFELPVVVQNQTDAPLDVDVAVQAANLTLPDPAAVGTGTRVTVPANDRVEVRFPLSAQDVGTARLRVVAVSGDLTDATEVELPVYTPATAEAFATYGVIDEAGSAIAQPVVPPTGVFPEFGGLEINTSSTALQALTDAVIYLEDYPYETPDGYSSRIMAIASLRDVLDAFDADGLPDPDALDARVADDIARLVALQNDDGGWSWWTRGLESVPWTSIQSAHALVLAREAGYDVPSGAFDRALAHLADIESYIPGEYGREAREMLRAYAIHVRTLAGDRDVAKATAIYQESNDILQLDAIAWLWPSIDDGGIRAEIERLFLNRATDTAGAATFATSYGEDAYLVAHSDRRTDGVILDALITLAPGSDLIPKVVAGLLGNQTRGRWNSAQDNAFILIALNRYFDTFEAVTPDFVARAWLGDTYVSEQSFVGRTTDRAATLVPMDVLQTDLAAPGDLVLQKDGAGRMYYRLGLRYAPSDLQLAARDEGFVVDRVYEAIDDPSEVTRDDDGTWRIRAGASVRVRLTMVADARRTHVALIDPLPAGLEPVNPALAVSQTFRPEQVEGDGAISPVVDWCWCWQWFEHQNLRDDRAEAFTSFLEGGTYEYTYIARATTPGQFVVPPTRAEEIYAPEVFGRSESATVIVE